MNGIKISFSISGIWVLNVSQRTERKELYLSSEYIHSKAIETAYDSLLDVQSKVIQSPHSGEQETRPAPTEHVYVYSSSFS